jgi:predicted nucleic acid-binding protein
MSGTKVAILDSNIIIDFFSGKKDVVKLVTQLEQVFTTSIVLGELYVGINRISNKVKHFKKLESFLSLCTVLHVDSVTAQYFGQTVAALYKKGNPSLPMMCGLQLLPSSTNYL